MSNTLTVVAGQSVKDGLTAKQEAFAQGVSDGLTLSDAYRKAYDAENMKDSTVWSKASLMMKPQGKVGARVKALNEAKLNQTLHSSARLKALVLERLHHEALTAPNASSRIQALTMLGKSIALFTEAHTIETETRASTDIEADLVARLKELTGT